MIRGGLRLAAAVPSRVAAGVVTGLVVAVVAPLAFGGHDFAVMSGSMAPAIDTGDVVVVVPLAPTDARPGDVVTFKDPGGSRLITHRVRGIRRAGATVRFVTRGDANNRGERWSVPTTGEIGRVAYRLPKAGYLSRAAASPTGRIVLVIGPVLLLGLWALTRIWRPAQAAATP